MKKINWNNPVIYFAIGIVGISIATIISSKLFVKKKQDIIYSIDIHDGDSIVIYKKHYSHDNMK